MTEEINEIKLHHKMEAKFFSFVFKCQAHYSYCQLKIIFIKALENYNKRELLEVNFPKVLAGAVLMLMKILVQYYLQVKMIIYCEDYSINNTE